MKNQKVKSYIELYRGFAPILILLVVVALGVMGFVSYKFGINKISGPVTRLPIVTNKPNSSLSPTSDPTATWKTFSNSKYDFTFKYPSGYVVEERVFGFLVIKSPSDPAPQAGISIDSRITGPHSNYAEIKKIINQRNIATTKNLGIWEIFQGSDKTGMLTDIVFRTGITSYKTGAIGLEVLANTSYANDFDQILSTFQFTDVNTTPSSKPVAYTTLNYALPSGWKASNDPTNSYQVGYNPTTQEIKIENGSIVITNKNLDNNPYYSPYSNSMSLSVKSYNGGSRHQFIYDQLGEDPNKTGSKMANYKEYNYTIDGKSCLILDGVSISQFPTVWGMCAINNTQAVSFSNFQHFSYLETLKTLKFFK